MTGNASSLGEVAKPILFHGVKASCNVLLRGRRGTSWHSHVSANVSKMLLYGRHNTFASFSEDELQFRGRLQHFETSIVISRGRHSTLDVSCRVCFRIAFSGLRQAATRCKVRGGRGLLWDVLKIDGSLALNIGFQVASCGVHQKTRRKTSILKEHAGTKCENWRKSRTKCSFWCSNVSGLESLVSFWPRRVYGGSCKTYPVSRCQSEL